MNLKKILVGLGVAAGLATSASAAVAGDFSISLKKGLVDKQDVNVISVSKSFYNLINLKADISNKAYKNYVVSVHLQDAVVDVPYEYFSFYTKFGYETFNVRSSVTETEMTYDPVTHEQVYTPVKTTSDEAKHQFYLGGAVTYTISDFVKLRNEVDLGSRAFTYKIGAQANVTKKIMVGAEFFRRWNKDKDYDNTNNILFNVSYTF